MPTLPWKTLLLWLPVLLLTLLPTWGYFPAAILVGLGALTLRSGWGMEKRNWTWGEWAGILLVVAVVVSLVEVAGRRDMSAWNGKAAAWWMGGLAVVVGKGWWEKEKSTAKWVSGLVLAGLIAELIWVGSNAVGSSYAELTNRLSYTDGIGNISQLAMLAGFLVLVLDALEEDKSYLRWAGLALALPMGYWLDSKLLLGVMALVGLGWLVRRWRPQWQGPVAWGLLGTGILAVLVVRPGFLAGRLDTTGILLENFDPSRIFGDGVGELDAFLNQAFLDGKASNTIGEIGPIAFNDYAQALVELGYPGLLALLGLSVAALLGRRPLASLGWVVITGIMFPLQYPETATLWGLTAGLLIADRSVAFSWPGKRFVPLALGGLGLLFSLFIALHSSELYQADQQAEQETSDGNGRGTSVQMYRTIAPDFQWDDAFHYQYARALIRGEQWQSGLEEYRLAIRLNPSYYFLADLGDALFKLGRHEEAFQEYARAQRLRPKHVYPGYRMVFCEIAMGKEVAGRARAKDLLAQDWGPVKPAQAMMLGELEALVGEE